MTFNWQPVTNVGLTAFNAQAVPAATMNYQQYATLGQPGTMLQAVQQVPVQVQVPVPCMQQYATCCGHDRNRRHRRDDDSDDDDDEYRGRRSGRKKNERLTNERLYNIELYLSAVDQEREAAEMDYAVAAAVDEAVASAVDAAIAQEEEILQWESYAAYEDSRAYYDALNESERAARKARARAARARAQSGGKHKPVHKGSSGGAHAHNSAVLDPAYGYAVPVPYGYPYY